MKDKLKLLDKLLMTAGFLSAGVSALINIKNGPNAWFWQIMCMVWILICFLKQMSIENLEDKE